MLISASIKNIKMKIYICNNNKLNQRVLHYSKTS